MAEQMAPLASGVDDTFSARRGVGMASCTCQLSGWKKEAFLPRHQLGWSSAWGDCSSPGTRHKLVQEEGGGYREFSWSEIFVTCCLLILNRYFLFGSLLVFSLGG